MKEIKIRKIDNRPATTTNINDIEKKVDNMPDGFERLEDNFYKIEKVGDSVLGKLMNITKSGRLNINFYDILNKATNETVRVPGSQDLDRKMAGVEIGDTVYIQLIELIETQYGNPMKIFAVGVNRKR